MPTAVQAIFSKATTLLDGSWRISFDCGEHSGTEVMEIAQKKDEALYVIVMTESEYLETRK